MTISLPDVNVLLALVWPNLKFHAQARAWFRRAHAHGWATCAVTQLGFVRLSSNPAFTPYPSTPAEATRILGELVARPSHRFVGDLPALHDVAFRQVSTKLQGHRQVTDAYRVSVAATHSLRLVTFNRRITHLASRRGALEILRAT